MVVIISGSRSFKNHPDAYQILQQAITESGFNPIIMIRAGGAAGIDKLAVRYAQDHDISHEEVYANWQQYGKGAGPERNRRMATMKPIADALICVHDGLSEGTMDMYTVMRDLGRKVFLKTVHHTYH